MKKSVIKRRKRVIPTTQDTQGDDCSSSGEQGVSPPPGAPAILSSQPSSQAATTDVDMERGTVNSDGSVNLGLRRRADHDLALVPEPVLRQTRQRQPSPRLGGGGDLTQYHSSSSRQHPASGPMMSDDNRLPPLTGIPSMATVERQPSLSPASFLSPSRKRSFSSSEQEYSGHPGSSGAGATGPGANTSGNEPALTKRMSSIKSILNAPTDDDGANSLGSISGPYPGIGGGISNMGSGGIGSSDRSSSQGPAREEKRATLQREAERMRQMLAAKERELAELD